jgi:hypothetical protein
MHVCERGFISHTNYRNSQSDLQNASHVVSLTELIFKLVLTKKKLTQRFFQGFVGNPVSVTDLLSGIDVEHHE